MEPMRWVRGVVPLAAAALMGAGVMTRPPVLVAADPSWQPPPCTDAGPPGRPPAAGGPAWYRLDGIVDVTGTLAGVRLSTGTVGGPTRAMPLPAESFASGPIGSLVLVGTDDGSRSRVSLMDVARGCLTALPAQRSVVRSGLLGLDGASVVEHRVDRMTRADLGVWRVPVKGGRATRILPGATPDERYGRTFTTELRWAPDGRLAVTSCGERACRTRLVEPASGRSVEIGPTGPVVGIDADGRVIAHERCGGYPCALIRVAADGSVQELAPAAGRAGMAGDRVVYEAGADHLLVLDLRAGPARAIEDDGLVPVGDGSMARSGVAHRGDSVLLAPRGMVDGAGARVLGPLGLATMGVGEVRR